MHKIDTRYAVTEPPAPEPAAVEGGGWFSAGNTAIGQRATEVSADWLNAVQGSLIEVIQAASLQLSKANPNLLLQAIRRVSADACWDIGTELVSHNQEFDPNVKWPWMVWHEDLSGTVRSSRSDAEGSIFNNPVGMIVGSDSVTLSANNIPPLQYKDWYYPENDVMLGGNERDLLPVGSIGANGTDTDNNRVLFRTSHTEGGDTPVNVVQRTKITRVWVRVG